MHKGGRVGGVSLRAKICGICGIDNDLYVGFVTLGNQRRTTWAGNGWLLAKAAVVDPSQGRPRCRFHHRKEGSHPIVGHRVSDGGGSGALTMRAKWCSRAAGVSIAVHPSKRGRNPARQCPCSARTSQPV